MSVTPPNSSVPSACPNLPCYPKKEPPLRPPDSSSEEWVLQLGFCLGLATLPRGSCGWVGCPRHLPALPASPLPASQRAERLTPPSWTQVQLRNPVLWREKELPGAPGQEGPVGSRERQALKEVPSSPPAVLPAPIKAHCPLGLVGLDPEDHENLRHWCSQDWESPGRQSTSFYFAVFVACSLHF